MKNKKRLLYAVILLIGLVVLGACSAEQPVSTVPLSNTSDEMEPSTLISPTATMEKIDETTSEPADAKTM